MLKFDKLQYSNLSQKKLTAVSGGFNRSGYNFGKNVRHVCDAISSALGVRSVWKSIR
ncbi:bacteriocin [Lactobacillus pentosus]|uniref:Bacteriocin n=1 Tax=Lactiplantibacillus pentosus TaxID=1589 RepID=A0AB37RIQ9_LACPE|nr:bacteriocin [Lactiplantibacillus pentosus]MCH4129469.1 bacteriocin [Lactiplantibacillus sp.]BBM21340.1 bacteriocin precursor peptide PlnE [Lactiplantibacillus plantarum]MCT3291633.1 bacteriocin [Lactiplantibacillus pentosus]MPQ19170.1 bacteriocin [Lactiplantibacillus pentosus]RMW46888.1 bacteriocin [Lactiplantibacillus pentosus]